MKNDKPANVDEYITMWPLAAQTKLIVIRKIIKELAPQAEEKISYGMPYYNLNGRLIYFSAHTNHIGLYPMKSAIKHFSKELSGYETSAGTVRFPLDKPLPLPLIRKIVLFRVEQNLQK